MRIPRESDLRSTVDKTWADAVTCCKGGAPHNCGADGWCEHGGSCFINRDMTLDQALQEITHMQKELDDARSKCNQVESKHLNLIARLKSEKSLAVKNGKSERVFAVSQCLRVLESS